MPIHDWTRAGAGTFHDFHSSWIVHLKESLNGGVLPEAYYALAEQCAGQVIPDVLTLQSAEPEATGALPAGAVAVAEAPPKVSLKMTPDEPRIYAMARRTLTIRHSSNHRIVAVIEIISPGNKDRARSVRGFVDKAIGVLQHGYHLLLIDLFPPGSFDPAGMHGEIWSEIGGKPYEPPLQRPLTVASYAAKALPEAYVEPLAVGSDLPEMPLFLDPDYYVNVPLESDYTAAYRGLPEYWRGVVEGK